MPNATHHKLFHIFVVTASITIMSLKWIPSACPVDKYNMQQWWSYLVL